MVRRATIEDQEQILEMCEKFINASPYKDYSNLDKVKLLSELFLNDPTSSSYAVFVVDGVGFIAGCITPFIFGDGLIATEQAWWVDPSERGSTAGLDLLHTFEAWAKDEGCFLVTMVCLDDRVGKYLEKNGYSLAERTFIKEL